MPLKDILVHIDDSPQSVSRLQLAVELARKHQAHLTGLYVVSPPPDTPRPHGHPISPWVLIAQPDRKSARKKADKVLSDKIERTQAAVEPAKQAFLWETARAGVEGEWYTVEGPLFDALTTYARFCDVAIVGQHYPEGERLLGKSVLDHLICSVGHAIMVVPEAHEASTVGERILIAWDRSPVALRAVHNARPFLRMADDVKVLAINIAPEPGSAPAGTGIVRHLARHDIAATAQHVDADGTNVGTAILNRAADMGIDLLVMGAYGHARLRERILGGVTYEILRHTRVPVLMCH